MFTTLHTLGGLALLPLSLSLFYMSSGVVWPAVLLHAVIATLTLSVGQFPLQQSIEPVTLTVRGNHTMLVETVCVVPNNKVLHRVNAELFIKIVQDVCL